MRRALIFKIIDSDPIDLDLLSGNQVVIAGDGTGSGADFSGASDAALDIANNRLITNTQRDPAALLSIDLSTGNRSLISKPGEKGDGVSISSVVDVSLDLEMDRALVLSQPQGAIFEVDLSTGDRKILFSDCMDETGIDQLGEDDGAIQNMYLDPERRELLVTGLKLLRFDLQTGSCAYSGSHLTTPLDLLKTPKGQIITSEFHQIRQYDFDSASEVVISE